MSYDNQIEIKEIKKQLNWLENEILEKINKNGYFDTIYEEFEFCINDRETNYSNHIYYEHIEKMLNHRFKNDFFEIEEKDISSRGFSYEFIFNKEKIVFKLKLGKNLKRKLIEKFIKKYPDTKDIFEKCGNFLKDNYLVLSNYDNEDNSPLYQLELGLKIIVAIKKNIKWNTIEKITIYSNEIIVDKEILSELEDEMLNDFENIKYKDIILKDYVDLVKDYFCKNN